MCHPSITVSWGKSGKRALASLRKVEKGAAVPREPSARATLVLAEDPLEALLLRIALLVCMSYVCVCVCVKKKQQKKKKKRKNNRKATIF